jgi:hypothetical protein
MSTEIVMKPTTKATLKRKVGYIDEEASVTRSKFAQMEITKESENRIASEPSMST